MISSGEQTTDLRSVHVKTHIGAEYVFPDMDIAELKKVLPESGRIPQSNPSLVLINVSSAAISIPLRIIETVHAADDEGKTELLWDCPASIADETSSPTKPSSSETS